MRKRKSATAKAVLLKNRLRGNRSVKPSRWRTAWAYMSRLCDWQDLAHTSTHDQTSTQRGTPPYDSCPGTRMRSYASTGTE
jgi:hypothetical protein